MTGRRGIALAAAALTALVAGGCGGDGSASSARSGEPATTRLVAPPARVEARPLRFAPYEPPAEEPYANGKRLAARVAQRLATHAAGESPARLAAAVAPAGMSAADLEQIVAPLIEPGRRSVGEVRYVQLSGTTATTLGTMVVVRQHLEDPAGRRTTVTRVMDVRLRRTDGPWSLERVGSVGGTPVPRPARLSAAAARVLDHPGIVLPDTARWDIHRGDVDDGLLRALATAADRRTIAVAVLRTGHPPTVWATTRRSAHASGYAADVYAVDDTLVLRQRTDGSPAQQLAAAFLAGGAEQVGSPWILPPGGDRSFTDSVHEDHVHVQQTPLPEAPPTGG